MHTLGAFQIVQRSPHRTRLMAAEGLPSPAGLTALRRRLMACDGVEDVFVDRDMLSVVVHHIGDFRWSSIGPAALRLDEPPASEPCERPLPPRAEPVAGRTLPPLVELAVAVALELAINRRPPGEIVQEVALSLLRAASREPRRA